MRLQLIGILGELAFIADFTQKFGVFRLTGLGELILVIQGYRPKNTVLVVQVKQPTHHQQ